MSWKNTSVLVTGASRGLGRAIAKAFAAEGADVGIGYHRFDTEAQKTVEEIRSLGGSAIAVKADVRKPEQIESAIKEFLNAFKKIDVLINNAAIVDDKPLVLMSEESWSAVLQTNLGGVFNCSKAVARLMMAQKKGVIINIASIAGFMASPGQANYSASKGGVIALTRTLARELASKGIRVNAVVPGLITEGMTKRLDKQVAENYLKRIPLARFGKADEIAKAVMFLASQDASYIIGQTLVVDGGLII